MIYDDEFTQSLVLCKQLPVRCGKSLIVNFGGNEPQREHICAIEEGGIESASYKLQKSTSPENCHRVPSVREQHDVMLIADSSLGLFFLEPIDLIEFLR